MILGTLTFSAQASQTTFERVFGVSGTLDPAMVEKVKALEPGQRFFVDKDKDGKNDEVWYIDLALRHTDSRRPILVRVIDEDGDLDEAGPDLDSDLYLGDWKADGVVDSVVDYQDNDGDGDVDEMGIYFGVYQQPWTDKNKVVVWYSVDVGDDNLLWYDVDWTYGQDTCQYRTHFSGDEVFYQFSLTQDEDQWLNVFEDPFAFYDPDGDDCSEEVVRICAVGHKVQSLRYSLDVDDDAFGRRTHDYDFSITALPDEGQVMTTDGICKAMTLRGIRTHPVLPPAETRPFAVNAAWAKACLTWDEINSNTEADVGRDPNERWEGIINHKSANFPQVGGPPCSALNKRNEVALKAMSPLKLYYDPTDRRLHLKGATEGWLHVDYDFDGKIDARYTYIDENKDGVFDRRLLDLNGDGRVDFDWKMKGKEVREFDLDWKPLSAFYKQELKDTLADSQAFIDAAKDEATRLIRATLKESKPLSLAGEAAVRQADTPGEQTNPAIANMRRTAAGMRLWVDLDRDTLMWTLTKLMDKSDVLVEIETAYAAGDYRTAAGIIRKQGDDGTRTSEKAFDSYSHRIGIRIDNTGGPRRADYPVALLAKDIKAVAGDYVSSEVVVAPQRWIDWRQIAGQLDEAHPPARKEKDAITISLRPDSELSFLADVPADDIVTYYLYYTPTGFVCREFPDKTCTAEDWVPPNIGWESNRVAYRAYWGQFDFFGKKVDTLIYPDIGSTSYHEETEWGIDALHVGKTSGLGGLTLYDGDKPYLVQNPAGKGDVKFTKRVLAQGPVRAVIEITAGNVIPDKPDLAVRMECLVYAERQETEIRVTVTGATEEMTLAPGIVKLPREQFFAEAGKGCFGSWGFQQDAIGEIGMGLIVSPGVVAEVLDLPEERQVKCRLTDGVLRYWVIGDWRRGRQFPVAPTIDNWRKELNILGDSLLRDVRIEIGQPEPAQ